jgi:hypothetical protein
LRTIAGADTRIKDALDDRSDPLLRRSATRRNGIGGASEVVQMGTLGVVELEC